MACLKIYNVNSIVVIDFDLALEDAIYSALH